MSGGKSAALIAEVLRQVHIPHYRGILFRCTYKQLEHLIDETQTLYPRAFPGAKFNKTEKQWRFPSGASIFFGYMASENDKYNYQGKPYDFIGFDELTLFTESQYLYLMSRNRPNGKGTRVYIRATANPGGIGHAWVKTRFIDAAPPMTPIEDEYKITAPDGKIITQKKRRIFVPSSVFDNKALLDNDPTYLSNLSMLPEAERNALLYGDWNSFEGQFFREWTNAPEHYRDGRYTHVIDPFPIPKHWKIWRGFDFGYAKPFSVGWYAANEDGKLYRIREMYGCTEKANTGLRIDPVEIARRIRATELSDPLLRGRDIYGVADPSIFDESRGASIAQSMAQSPNFVMWTPGDNARIAGWMQMHYRMAFDNNGECMFQVFNTCREFIRTIPTLVYDEKHVEDLNTDMEDHQADECLTGDTLVWTDGGKIPIRELEWTTGRVYSSDGELHEYTDCRMTRTGAEVFEIEMDDGATFRATGNHPVMLADGRYVRVDELQEGDEVAMIGGRK